MKMIPAGTSAANQYRNFAHNCLRNAACEPSYTAPLPSVSDMQLYVDFGSVQPTTMEFTFIDHCNNTTEQIFPSQYTVGQTPEGGWYGVFRNFNNPAVPFTAFVVHLSINGGSNTYFSEMLSTEPCGPLMKIKSCHPEGATTTGFDVNGIYYGLPQGSFLGTGIRYWHIAWVRNGKVRELGDKATFKSNLYSNFRTTIEKTHLIQTEIVPKWYKNELLAIYSRGALSVDEGQIYLVSDLAFEALLDDDLQWKPYAQLKETFRLFYGCDDARCEECCNPTLVSVQINDGPPVTSSSQGPSEPAPTGCLRVIFQISGSGPWAIGGLMCDGHALSMEAVAGDGIVPLPLCVQYDSLTGIAPPVSIIYTEPCPNDCVIYRNPSATENTTGITYKDCAGVWHEDVMLLPGEEICARRSYVIGPTTGVQGPGSGTLVEIGTCGSFPDDSEPDPGSGSGGGSEPPAECCDPTLIDATTETTIPDGSLPGGDSESESAVCCTPVVLSATMETIDDGSGSSSGGGIIEVFLDGIHTTGTEDLTDQATLISALPLINVTDFSFEMDSGEDDFMISVIVPKLGGLDSQADYTIGGTAGSPMWAGEDDLGAGGWRMYIINSVSGYISSGTITIDSNDGSEALPPGLRMQFKPGTFAPYAAMSVGDWNTFFDTGTFAGSPFLNALPIVGTNEIILTDSGFLTLKTDLFNGNNDLVRIIDENLIINTIQDRVFQGCSELIEVDFKAVSAVGNNVFNSCSVLSEINLRLCTDLGGSVFTDDVFIFITGNTITLTIPTATASDTDVTDLQSFNTVTLILV